MTLPDELTADAFRFASPCPDSGGSMSTELLVSITCNRDMADNIASSEIADRMDIYILAKDVD